MSAQTETAPYSPSDYQAEQAATEKAAAGKWEQYAQPGFESKVGEIAVDAAHDLADEQHQIDVRSAEELAQHIEVHRN